MSSLVASNRRNWDCLVPIHAKSKFYDVPAFLRGGTTLRKVERELVGECTGCRLLHLQCHFGLDTLSWSRLGARVTGVDFSAVALDEAHRLAAKANIQATFLQRDVQELTFQGEFDVVVTTYGVLCWIEDLQRWASGIAQSLKLGGRFVLVDFHPMLEAVYPGKMTGARRYFGGPQAAQVRTKGTYTDGGADLEYDEYRWQHPVAEVISALVRAGLRVNHFKEHDFCSYGLFDELREVEPGVWCPSTPCVWPYMFSFVGTKDALKC